jgi:transposase
MLITTLGIDLGKNWCQLVGLSADGAVLLRKRVRRNNLLRLTVNMSPCRVAMEACCGAHHIGRHLAAQGHDVRLLCAEYVRPYVKAHKNDDRDAEGIAEAATRPTMRTVALKSEAQLDLQVLHRVRERLTRARTAVINQLRAILLERGIAVARGPRKLAAALPDILADGDDSLSARMRVAVQTLRQEWLALETEVKSLDLEFWRLAKSDHAANRLAQIPGIGPLTATALVAAVADGSGFRRGRDLAAWLGLVPHQHSTGGKAKLLGISKRGNPYLRRLLIHGARGAMASLSAQPSALGRWLAALRQRTHPNVAVVALANKLARIAWAVLAGRRQFSPEMMPASSA